MDLRERALYHQVHPLKLATDVGAGLASLVLLWRHQIEAGLLVLLVPPAFASIYLVVWGRIDYLAATRFGRYVRRNMTGPAQAMRLIGMLALCVGAWRHQWALLIAGGLAIAWVWTRGLVRPF